MPLTDTAARNAKADAGGKDIKLSDAGGLFLLVKPNGAKYWRLSYRHLGKQKTLAVGVYPTVTLKDARDAREEAKRLLSQGIDPSAHRQQTKALKLELAGNSFEAITREWLAMRTPLWSASNALKVCRSFEADLFPWLGHRPITDISAPDLLAVFRRIEARGAIETAHRAKQRTGEVFRYAIATGRAERDPVPDLRGALTPVRQRHFPTVTDPKRIGEILRLMDSYKGTLVVRCALRLSPMVFVRPGNLRHAEWAEIDLDAAEWRIPAEKMKSGDKHTVPLASQAVEVLRELQPLTGRGRYVFPSARAGGRPMSDNAILVALRTIGIPKDELVGHGFRGMASTVLHEQGWNTEVIERQLAHAERNKVKAAYNHAQHMPERKRMMQAWADYLDGLRNGAEVIPIGRTA